jgi:protein TonB
MRPIPPMPMQPLVQNPPAPRTELPGWIPETPPIEDDFAQIAAQARQGVQRKVVDEASRRKRQRLLTACGVAVVVAGALVFLIEKFYDPEARAREKAIATEVTRMAEQQKVTDRLTLIEIEIENAIMNNDLDTARRELARLIEQAPAHPRHEFLKASIDRAAELARLSAQGGAAGAPQPTPAQAAMLPSGNERSTSRPRATERPPERVNRAASATPQRTASTRPRDTAPAAPRAYGAPIGEVPRQTLPLNAPINSEPVTTLRRPDTSFAGRTVEAGDPPLTRAPSASVPPSDSNGAGSAVVPMPSSMPPAAPVQPAPVDVVPAKIVKRVTPVAPGNISAKTKGHVVVRFDIGVNGRVSNIEIVESQPKGVFDAAAQDAVRKWIYEPRRENGVAVDSSAKARLVFEAAN